VEQKIAKAFTSLVMIAVLTMSALAADAPSATETPTGEEKSESLTEISKKLTNPVSEIWSITFQQNNYKLVTIPGHEDRWSSNLNFQPVMPISLTEDFMLITRPVMPLFISEPHPVMETSSPSEVDVQTTTGFGDTIFMEMLGLSQKLTGNWLLGIGPTFIFPTATTDFTGQGKWQVGPAAVVGYLSEKHILGVFVQNWTSFAGDSSRPNTNSMNLQPIVAIFLPHGWSIGYSGNMLANWKADSGNVWTVPIGVGISKVWKFGPFPVKIGIGGQWMPIHPDAFGQKWNVQVIFSPVIPKLVKGTLFE
jgi:hypothetical protein